MSKGSAITVGTFDGVHLGHQFLINETKRIAKEYGLKSIAVTFDKSPRKVLSSDYKFCEITSLNVKIEMLKNLGLDEVVVLEFSHDLLELSYIDFVNQILIKKYDLKHLVIGYDFHLGKDRKGNFQTLKELGKKIGFVVTQVEKFKLKKGLYPSSELIRKYIQEKNYAKASKLLGWEYDVRN